MRVLGISCDFHDAAAALVIDGAVIAAAEEERFSGRKHDPSLPVGAIASVLARGGLEPDDLDRVVFHEKPLVTIARVAAARQHQGPRSWRTFTDELPQLIGTNLFVGLRLEQALRRLGARRAPTIRYCEHHLSHAAAAFFPSPFSSAAVLTVDGIGEWATASIGRGTGSHVDLLWEQRYPDSVGLLYSAVTELCGFAPNDGEYKLMGLAPYGEPRHLEALRSLVEVHPDGSVRLSPTISGHWSKAATRLGQVLGRTRTEPGTPPTRDDADLARSIQVLLEEILLAMAEHAHRVTGERSLCLAGGVALNCVATGRLLRDGPFEDIWTQPAAGDAGSAIGAALWLSHTEEGVARPVPRPGDGMQGSLLGPSFAPDLVAEWLEGAGVAHQRVPDRRERAQLVSQALEDGRFVGWFEGAMEFGPRALGHRSILADPRSPTAQRDLNLAVKERESFRPFAPAVLEERAHDWFELDRPARYMTVTAAVHPSQRTGEVVDPSGSSGLALPAEVRSTIPACTHVDGSARVQTVPEERDDGFRALLEAFEERTGCPVLLNTSFNGAGEPIVCTPDDAAATARRIGLDLLVLEDCVIEVTDLPEQLSPPPWPEAPATRATAELARAEPTTGLGTPAKVAAAVVVALGPAVLAATVAGRAEAALVAGLQVGAMGAMRAVGPRAWWARLLIAIGVASAVAAISSVHTAGWAAAALLAFDACAWERRVLPRLPRGRTEGLPPIIAIGVVMAWFAREPGNEARIRILLAVMVIVVSLISLAPERATRVVARISVLAGRAVARVGGSVLWVVAVLGPWAARRVVGVDPLRPAGTDPTTTWTRRESGGAMAHEPWRRDPASAGIPWGLRLRRGVGSLLVLGLVAGAAVLAVDAVRPTGSESAGGAPGPTHTNTDPGAIPAAFEGEEWFPEYREDIAWLWRTGISWDPLAPVRLRDVTTRHVTIVDGARRSWVPPECDCRRVKVWMYGGSTTFGLGQRDEHTIASYIARTAWEDDGIAIDIDNRGVVGDHHWEEANRFAWDLATLPAPDVVIFLDGINDVQAVDRQREVTRQPLSFIKDDFWRNYLEVTDPAIVDPRWAPDPGPGGPPPGAVVPTTEPLVHEDVEELGRYVASRYETARKISASAAAGADVEAAWFWQPAIENRPFIEGEPPPNGREWSLERYRAAAAATGREVIDISDALDGVLEPLYWDQFHTNEVGARIVGERIYDEIRSDVRRASRTAD